MPLTHRLPAICLLGMHCKKGSLSLSLRFLLPMSEPGQNAKYSPRVDVFCFASINRHTAVGPAGPFGAIRRHTRSLPPTTAIVAGPLRWTAVGHPFSEQINAGLRPWAFAPWRRRRHYGATNSTNAVINSSCVSFDFIIARQVEPLYHPLNVSLSKKRANIGLKACGHRASLRDWGRNFSGKPAS